MQALMMEHAAFSDPALTLAIALAAGMLGQTLARHLRVPGIVLLLAFGILLGPDLLNAVRPSTLGPWLHTLIGFAVAVILFEGGMNLNVARLRREARSIQQLSTLGALTTAVCATLAARWIMGWDWTPAILFGTLVMVTGPTVITPLLRRIKVKERVATVLEAEGILVDAIGAIVAVVALEVAMELSQNPEGSPVLTGVLHVVSRLFFGCVLGTAGGLALAALLRSEKAIPEGLESVFTLSFAIALFQGSNALVPETGIVTVIVAGLVVGSSGSHVLAELREFKEQLTVLLIGLLFVLLAADVRLAQVQELGWAGLGLVAALMFLVRPLTILAGTAGSDLTWREKAFLSWLAPRGIVAAAVSSLFAETLAAEGVPGGEELRAMVFLVIAVTVVVQGLTGGPVASLLGVRRPSDSGFVILGANDLARAVGRALRAEGEEVIFIDSNENACEAAEAEGFRVLHGSGLWPEIQRQAALDTRAGCLGLTSNEEVNLLFARRVSKDFKVPRVWAAVRRGHLGVSEENVHRLGVHLLFGAPQDVVRWTRLFENGEAVVERWRLGSARSAGIEEAAKLLDGALPVAFSRGRRAFPVGKTVTFRRGDTLHIALQPGRRSEISQRLLTEGWEPAGELREVPHESTLA
jgi:NhaP-type Na+/H+ or K+/H+ antiporter